MDNTKFLKGDTYLFETITGNKVHEFKIIKRESKKDSNDFRVLATLDGGNEVYYYGTRKFSKFKQIDIINIEKWRTAVTSEDEIKQSESIKKLQKDLGRILLP